MTHLTPSRLDLARRDTPIQALERLPAALADMPDRDWIDDFSPGYLRRVMHRFPRQGDHAPWVNPQDYRADRKLFLEAPTLALSGSFQANGGGGAGGEAFFGDASNGEDGRDDGERAGGGGGADGAGDGGQGGALAELSGSNGGNGDAPGGGGGAAGRVRFVHLAGELTDASTCSPARTTGDLALR